MCLRNTAKSIKERRITRMSEAILQINHLSKTFGKNEVLKDVDFSNAFSASVEMIIIFSLLFY